MWLTPESNWKQRYAGWPAMKKLDYMDELMKSLAGKPPLHNPPFKVAEYHFLNLKLKTYYARKRKAYADSFLDFYDKDLRNLFSAPAGTEGAEKASIWLRRRRRSIVKAVSRWSSEHKFRIDQLLKKITARCDALGLRTSAPRDDARRGGHLCVHEPAARELTGRLFADCRVLADYRDPDVIRLGCSPLTTRFADVARATVAIAELRSGGVGIV